MSNVVKTLKKVILNENFARKLIESGVKQIKPEDFENAMRNKWDPSRLILNHFHNIIEQPRIKPLVQFSLKLYWNEIEENLTDVRKIFNILCKNEKLKKILKKKEARRYLNFACAGAYYRLYKWVWFGENPYCD